MNTYKKYRLCINIYIYTIFFAGLSLFSQNANALNNYSRTVPIGVYENKPKIYTDQTGKLSEISPMILEDITNEEKWIKEPPNVSSSKYISKVITIIFILLFLFVTFILLLRWQMRQKTQKLTEANKMLTESRQTFCDLFYKNSAVKIIVNSKTNQIMKANKAAELFFGHSSQILKEKKICDLFSEKETILKQIEKHSNSELLHFETTAALSDFTKKTVAIFSSKIISKGITIYYLTLNDLSKQKEAEKDITKLQEQLAQVQKLEVVGSLVSGITHDYNNMLSVILGHTELALNKSSSLPGLHKNLKTIFTAARRSADITSELLNFTRKQSTNAEILNLNDEIKTILEMLQLLMGENIKLEWNFSFKSWPVKIDRSQLHQIVTNLCINARDALFGAGKIKIELFNITINEKKTLKKSELPPGDFVRLEICDNGCGMDKSTISNIFEPFFTTKQKGKGVGLGLSSVWNIVQQNNGFIDVASEKEKGTCFIIYFPRQKDQHEDINTEDYLLFEGNNETILLVEDNEMVKEMCLESLNFLNYKVLGTSTPAKALMLASKSPSNISLLITDIIMPQINGAELAKLLKEKYPDLKVLFMSGHTPDILDHYNINLNSNNFLQKPFTQRNLAQKVSKVLRQL